MNWANNWPIALGSIAIENDRKTREAEKVDCKVSKKLSAYRTIFRLGERAGKSGWKSAY